MIYRKYLIAGCLIGASFFVGCNQNAQNEKNVQKQQEDKELEMYEGSELADLMNSMYERNLKLGEQISAGNIPTEFPEDFYRIHTAEATPGMLHDTAVFKSMAGQYLVNMQKITEAESVREAKIAYNEMIMTCASCHQVYCRGPLSRIKKMKLPLNDLDG